MKNTAILYGSDTGTTKSIAGKIAKILDIPAENIYDVATAAPSVVGDYENLILGTSTWNNGELPASWQDFLHGLASLDLKDKKIAIYGCGDETMSDSFNDAVGELYLALKPTGAKFVGSYDADGYHFDKTKAEIDGKIVGLLLDEVNHPELTDFRLRSWLGILADAFKD